MAAGNARPGDDERTEDDFVADVHDQDLFESAQQEYLKQNWYETETLLRKLLLACETDIPARLMLAALCRHTGRIEEAGIELNRVALSDGSDEWEFEIEQQRELLADTRSDNEEESEPEESLSPAA